MTGCPICGATTRLGPDGACSWRAGCEHRAMQAEARSTRAKADDDRFLALLDAEAAFHMDKLGCGHTAAEHAEQLGRQPGMPFGVWEPEFWSEIRATLWDGDPADPASRPLGSTSRDPDSGFTWAPEIDGSGYSRADWPDGEPPSDWS